MSQKEKRRELHTRHVLPCKKGGKKKGEDGPARKKKGTTYTSRSFLFSYCSFSRVVRVSFMGDPKVNARQL